MCSQLSAAASGTNPPPPPPTPPSAPEDVPPLSRKPCIPIPARYIGELGQCGQFLNQYSLVFDQQPGTHATDKARVAFIVSLLGGRASQWAVAASRLQAPFCSSFTLFSAELLKIFDQPVRGKEISKRLLSLKQGANSVADFAVNFRILAAGTGWDEAALQGVFSQGLAENIQDELAAWDDTTSLEELVSLAIRLDNRLRERRRERALRSPPAVTVPRPMSFVPTSPADRAHSLPPHRPYNCTINLLPGATLPSSCLYSLSHPERDAMELYIRDSLAAGLIGLSSSLVGFFFRWEEGWITPTLHRLQGA